MTGIILPRRAFLAGLAAALTAPAIVRAESLMPVKAMRQQLLRSAWTPLFWMGDGITFEGKVVGRVLAVQSEPAGDGRALQQVLTVSMDHPGMGYCVTRLRPVDNPWIGRFGPEILL